MPPLYGAKKKKPKEFIPIYDVKDCERYQKKGYEIQRFKGLGEMTEDQIKVTISSHVEYVLKYPKSQKIIDNLLKIITDSNEKRKYLEKIDLNFQTFIKQVFENLEGENHGS